MDLSILSDTDFNTLYNQVLDEHKRRCYNLQSQCLKLYNQGIRYTGDYGDMTIVIKNYDLAYESFYEAYQLGHVLSGYNIGYLHELAVTKNIPNKFTLKDNLRYAAQYYASGSKYFSGADDSYKRIVALSFDKLTGHDSVVIDPQIIIPDESNLLIHDKYE
jgi:hypothetical protein